MQRMRFPGRPFTPVCYRPPRLFVFSFGTNNARPGRSWMSPYQNGFYCLSHLNGEPWGVLPDSYPPLNLNIIITDRKSPPTCIPQTKISSHEVELEPVDSSSAAATAPADTVPTRRRRLPLNAVAAALNETVTAKTSKR